MKEHDLDASGLCCPMPMVRTNQAMQSLEAGDVLRLTATDPATKQDIPSWCKRKGYNLLETTDTNGTYFYKIKK